MKYFLFAIIAGRINMKNNFICRILCFLLVWSLLTSFLRTDFFVYAQDFEALRENVSMVNSYELFFPMVAGTLPTQKTYILKVVRDEGAILFSSDKGTKIARLLDVSDKRLLEAEQLLLQGNQELALKSLNDSRRKILKVVKIMNDLSRKDKNEELILNSSLAMSETAAKQQRLLLFLSKNTSGNLLESLKLNYDTAKSLEMFSDEILFKFLHR